MKYIDTSAFVKYYRREEEGSEKIKTLIDNSKEVNEQLMSSFLENKGSGSLCNKPLPDMLENL